MTHGNENLSKVGQFRRAMELEERREEMRAERVMELIRTIHSGVSALIEAQAKTCNPFEEAATELKEIAASLTQAIETFEDWRLEAQKASPPSFQEMKEISQNQERLLRQLKAQTKILEEGLTCPPKPEPEILLISGQRRGGYGQERPSTGADNRQTA